MNNHGTQDKPAINTHTRERERATVMAACYSMVSARQIPSCHLQSMHSTTSTYVLCQRAPAKATKVACGRGKLPHKESDLARLVHDIEEIKTKNELSIFTR